MGGLRRMQAQAGAAEDSWVLTGQCWLASEPTRLHESQASPYTLPAMPVVPACLSLQECSFQPSLVAQPRGGEGRAIKLAASLTQSKRASEAEEQGSKPLGQAAKAGSGAPGPAQTAPAGGRDGGGSGEQRLHFDALERQINEALVRLSLTEEQVAASLHQAAVDGAPEPAELPAPARAGAGAFPGLQGRPGTAALACCCRCFCSCCRLAGAYTGTYWPPHKKLIPPPPDCSPPAPPACPALPSVQLASLWMPTATGWTLGPSAAHPPPMA